MAKKLEPGLGELLRHLTDLVDSGAQAAYRAKGIGYRPRYTPVMRVLAEGIQSVGQIAAHLAITQGAVSQTLTLMENDGLIARKSGNDARQTVVALTERGRDLLAVLKPHWRATFRAVEMLESEVKIPVRAVLEKTIAALSKSGFEARILAADPRHTRRGHG